MTRKVVVAHPYQQHSYRTASAVNKIGMLDKYITTVYNKKGSLTNDFLRLLSGDNKKRAEGRKCKDLNDDKVMLISEFDSLLLLLFKRLGNNKLINKFNSYVLKCFNIKLAKYLINNDIDVVILYDTVCADCIKYLKSKQSKTKIIIDMSAPNFQYMNNIYISDSKRNSIVNKEMVKESNSIDYNRKVNNSEYEIKYADFFLVASTFSRDSLIYSGVNENQIFLCRYGIDVCNEYIPKNNLKKKKIVFIGDATAKKGIHYFKRIVDKLDNNDFEYHIIGQYSENNYWYQNMKDICIFHGYITHDKVLEICRDMDFIIFPSLADGFGLSVLEAMSCGVIPFVSKNSGVSDIICSGVNGYVFELQEIEKIVPEIVYLFDNPEKCITMSKESYKTAKKMHWSNYNDNVKNALGQIF